MSRKDKKRRDEQDPQGQNAPDPSENEARNVGDDEQAFEQGAETVERDVSDALEAAQQERDDMEQRLLRTAADFQNFRKRAEQNMASAREQQLLDVVRGLVTVLDHFDSALQVDPETTSTHDLLAGMTMVRDELMRALEQYGVKRLDVESGEPFDPNHHEALMRQQSDDVQSQHVTTQLRPGYRLNDKIVRPAQVSVAE